MSIDIAEYIRQMKFKRALFGVSEEDVIEKLMKLNELYQEELTQLQEETEAPSKEPEKDDEYQKQTELLSEAVLKIQNSQSYLLEEAKLQQEQLLEDAKKQARRIVMDAQKKADLVLEKKQREIDELERMKAEIEDGLKRYRTLLDTYFSGESLFEPDNTLDTIPNMVRDLFHDIS